MSTASVPPSDDGSSSFQASTPGASHPLSQSIRGVWSRIAHWFQANSFAPRWLPEWLRHPLFGYLLAVIIELAAAVVLMLLISLFPSFAFRGILTDVGVLLIALGWGAGPGLCATLVGTFLLYYALLPPYFSWSLEDPADTFGLLMYLVVGCGISILASRSTRARWQAEEHSRLLAQARARSENDYRRLRTVLDVLPSAVLIAGPQGELLEMNPASKTLWGEEVPLAAGIAQYTLYKARWARTGQPLAPEDWTVARALSTGAAALNDELEIETSDGQRKVILNSAAPIRDETGAITGAVISAQDVSEVRRLEREVAEHAAELDIIFGAITDGIALLNDQGRLVQANQALRDMLGMEQSSVYSTLPLHKRMAALAVRNEQGQPLLAESWPAVRILQGETLQGADVLLTRLDGKEAVVNISGAPIRDHAGNITGSVQVFRDVTRRHQMDRRTRETLSALVAMAEAMVQAPSFETVEQADGLPATAPLASPLPALARRLAELTRNVLSCRCVSIAAVEAQTGLLHPISIVGLPAEQEQAWWASWSSPQHLEERFDADIASAVEAGEPIVLDSQRLPKDSRHLYGASVGLLIPMRIGEELVGLLLVDYSEAGRVAPSEEDMILARTISRLGALVLERDRLLRRWAEARTHAVALRETQEHMESFVGIVSHELKNPLAGIQLGLQLGQRRLRRLEGQHAETGSDVGKVEDSLAQAGQQAQLLERLINDLVEGTRIRAGKLELRLAPVDLAVLVRQAVERQQQIAPTRVLRLQLPAEQQEPVEVDADRIGQVVTNYLTNALKYSPADRPIDVGLERVGHSARVWVRDEGPGIPPEEQTRIWERFHRVKGIEARGGPGGGLGLGLHVCRTIIEQHHGQVGVESAPGQGSTFWFTLPLECSQP
ncbi:MAG TPA: ATP-binding protein [Ktedonobacterales bacterium]|nr:ATP-binding protein [Ktedonobacterales bacterium]